MLPCSSWISLGSATGSPAMTIHSGLAPAGVCHLCANICTGLNLTCDLKSLCDIWFSLLGMQFTILPSEDKLFYVHNSARFSFFAVADVENLSCSSIAVAQHLAVCVVV